MELTNPNRHKTRTINQWKRSGVINDNLEEIYETYIKTMNCTHCGKEFRNTKERHLDHDHATGLFRKIVCQGCNCNDVYIRFPAGIPSEQERNKINQKKYKDQNRDKINEKSKEYYDNNRDKIREKNKEWEKRNRDKINERRRKRFEEKTPEMKDKINERKREKYQERKEKAKEYYQNNKEKKKEQERKRYQEKKQLGLN